MLTQRHLQDVCLLHYGARQCRYLDRDHVDYNKYFCRKLTPDRELIDEITERHQKGGSSTEPAGDNCTGYLPFRDLQQGYDLEKP